MRKSRIETVKTRERIVSTAAALFVEEGLAGVGMRGVMEAANLTQGGFYRHFDSRDELIAEATCSAFDRLLAMFEARTAGDAASVAVEKIVALYLGQSRSGKNAYLCPLAMLGAEVTHSTPEVRAAAMDGHERMVRLLAKHFAGLPEEAALGLASGIVSTMVGAVTLSNIATDEAAATSIHDAALASIRERLASRKPFRKERKTT